MVTYRKTKNNQWVAFGPASELRIGEVRVSKKNGSTQLEDIVRLGNEFSVNGVPHVYGYIGFKARTRYSGRYQSHVIYFPGSGESMKVNKRGRCIDAPCCGCCD